VAEGAQQIFKSSSLFFFSRLGFFLGTVLRWGGAVPTDPRKHAYDLQYI